MRRECLVLWVSANDLLAGVSVGDYSRFPGLLLSRPGLGYQEMRGIDRLIQITTFTAINAELKISII